MKSASALPLALSASLTLLGACSKPADTPVEAVAATEAAAPAAGGAISPPAANGAVNADANATDVAAASSSFTEEQARGHIEHAGFSDVSDLAKRADGLWAGKAMHNGKSVDVAVDFKGAVTAK